MSLDTTATTEWNGMTKEAEASNRFIRIYQTKGYAEALAFHTSLTSDLQDYVKYSSVSQGHYDDARDQLEGDLRNVRSRNL